MTTNTALDALPLSMLAACHVARSDERSPVWEEMHRLGMHEHLTLIEMAEAWECTVVCTAFAGAIRPGWLCAPKGLRLPSGLVNEPVRTWSELERQIGELRLEWGARGFDPTEALARLAEK